MPLVRLLTSRVVFQNAGHVSQVAGQVIQVSDREADAMLAGQLAELVDGEVIDLPPKTGKPTVAATQQATAEPQAQPEPAKPEPQAQPKPFALPSGASIEALGLNDKIVDALAAAGIHTVGQLAAIEDLTSIDGIGRVTAERIVTAIRKLTDGALPDANG